MSKLENIFFGLFCAIVSLFQGKANKKVFDPAKVLIVRWKPHIGDVVYITPLFRAVKRTYPNTKLFVLGKGRVEEVIRHNPDVDAYIHYDDNFWSILKKLRSEKIDFACLANLGSTKGLAVLYLAGIPSISAFQMADEADETSWSYRFLKRLVISKPFVKGFYVPPQYLRLLKPIQADTGDTHFRLYYSSYAIELVKKVLNENTIDLERDFLVGLAPGGSTPERWWPSDRFAAVADYLSDTYNAKILLLGAGHDRTPIEEVMASVKPSTKVVNLLNQSLDEFKATVAKTKLMIGNDSGPMVTADAFDVPNLVFVGPTNAQEYHLSSGPFNRVVISPTKNIHDITLRTALSEIEIITHNIQDRIQLAKHGDTTSQCVKQVNIPVSPAELIDRICILEIKAERITQPEKNKSIQQELGFLRDIFYKNVIVTQELEKLTTRLKTVSRRGWDIEDIKRACEKSEDFGSRFIEAARAAFKNNDERAAVWKEINSLLKSNIIQEKSYEKY